MNQLPKGWKVKRLSELCSFTRGLTYKKGDEVSLSQNIVLRANNITLETGKLNFDDIKYINDNITVPDEKIVRKGNLLICTASGSKTHLGKTALIDAEYGYAFGGFMGMITPLTGVDPKYLYWLTRSLYYSDFISSLSDGVNINNLKYSQLSEFPVPVPPLPEQKRIVAILDKAFEGIDKAIANTQKNLANARELFESYLNAKLLATASGHAVQKLSAITELIVDCEHNTAPTQETGYPSIRTPNVGKGNLILDGVNRVSAETDKKWTKRAVPLPGDLILAREAPAGNVGVIPEGESVCLGQRTVLIRPNKGIVDSNYLAFLILHPLIQKKLLAYSTGATVQHVNMKDIKRLPLSNLPSVTKQLKDVNLIRKASLGSQRLETIYQKKLTALAELKQSILYKAFTGELEGITP